jgi:hypothetical protein
VASLCWVCSLRCAVHAASICGVLLLYVWLISKLLEYQ